MTKPRTYPRIISRRDTLKIAIVPTAAVLSTRWLGACASADGSSEELTDTMDMVMSDSTAASMSQSSGATGSSTMSGGAATSTPSSAMGTAGASAAPAANGGSSTNAMASTPANTAAAGSSATGGSPATAGSSATQTMPTAGSMSNGMQSGSGAAGSSMAQAGAGGSMSTVAGPGVMWATGGTVVMADTYPDPFEMGAGTACRLYPSQTLGPCYADGPMMRADISDGLDGLPMRLSFLVVGSDGCTPMPGVTVDIWHAGSQGIYSAYATGTTCNPGRDDVMSDMFCRGVQATDETGRVNFATVFPGWYMGRTLHIHFTARINGREAVTSQLYFEDELVDEILAQGQYKARGTRDTKNTSDFIFSSGGATPDQVIMETAKRPDGILHAWKVLSIG